MSEAERPTSRTYLNAPHNCHADIVALTPPTVIVVECFPKRARQRIFLALVTWAWTRIPKEFSKADRERITPRVVEHLRNEGTPVRVMAPSSGDEAGLEFRPELFECRSRAIEVLEAAGIVWLSDYSSVDLLHEEYGLEVCGIAQESSVDRVAEAMRTGFPHWHYRGLCHKEGGRDPGWRFGIHMFPRCGGGRCAGAE